jgi:hypothetical protein
MPRTRSVKPSFFVDEILVEQPFEYRLLFIGLWCLADREGRLKDKTKSIKMQIFPGDDVDVEAGIAALTGANLIVRYQSQGEPCIQVVNFFKHQNPHPREVASVIDPPPGYVARIAAKADEGQTQSRQGQTQASPKKGKTRSGKKKTDTDALPAGFAEFWAAYPRKDSEEAAIKAWRKLAPEAELQARILADVIHRAAGEKWREKKGEFIPHAATYLNGKRWQDEGVKVNPELNGKPDSSVPDSMRFAQHKAAQRAAGAGS